MTSSFWISVAVSLGPISPSRVDLVFLRPGPCISNLSSAGTRRDGVGAAEVALLLCGRLSTDVNDCSDMLVQLF